MKENKQLRKQLFLHSKGWLSIAIVATVNLSVYNIIVSWLLQKIIDIAADTDSTPLIDVITVAIVSVAIFMVAYVIYCSARPRYIQSAMLQYKSYVFGRILDKRISSISRENSGKIISALTNDMRPVENYYIDSILKVIDIGVGFVGALVLMIWYSPVLAVVSLLLSILPIVVSVPSAKNWLIKRKICLTKTKVM